MAMRSAGSQEPTINWDGRLLLGGEWVPGDGDEIVVLDKYDLDPVARLNAASEDQIDIALGRAFDAYKRGAPATHERGAVLEKASGSIESNRAEFVAIMQREAGFTTADANGEVTRAVQTLKLAAEEARRLSGEVVPLEGAPGQAGRLAFTLRVPVGVVVAITPFNSPLNTVAHKLAPAFAAGNPVILKPSTSTPFTAALLARILIDAGMPDGFLSLIHGGGNSARRLLDDPRAGYFAFTGSTQVGRSIQQAAGLRRTQMELGSIAFTIVCDDADLDRALPKIANAGYRKAGQVCTSIQILLVQDTILEEVADRLTRMVNELSYGNPRDQKSVVGPVISQDAAIRIESWIDEATSKGAIRLAGGKREGAVVPPTLLRNVDTSMAVGCMEVFGPVMSIVGFKTFEDAIAQINDTPFGLASGIFTYRLDKAFQAARQLDVGGVHINETSSARVDLMPYGGTKESGFGREGPRYAIHEMTEERIVTFTISKGEKP